MKKILLIAFTILIILTKTSLLLALFFTPHDKFNSAAITLGIVSILVGLTLLISIFMNGIKKHFKYLIAIGTMLLIILLFPFEYVFGWTLHQFDRENRTVLLTNLKAGRLDSSIKKNENADHGTWISTHPRIKVFKDSSFQLIFISRGDITCYDYYGSLFISDPAKVSNQILSEFLSSEFNKWRLGNNWYLIECYTDTTPGP